MAKGFGLNGFLIGAVVGAGLLYVAEHLRNFSVSGSLAPPSTPAALSHVAYANVGILPNGELPFYDDLDDSAPRGTSPVWDRRTSKYRTDSILYNTIGPPVFSDGTADWDPNKGLNMAGAYRAGNEDSPRPRQEHYASGVFPEALSSPNYPY